MNFLKQYKSIFEKRATDDLAGGIHETPYDQIMKYVNVPNIFISFRSIDKIGINPKSHYNTPNGIYCYPLKEISKNFNHQNKKIIVPFAGENPYCYVIQINSGIRGIKLGEYNKLNLSEDIKILQREYKYLTDYKIKKYKQKSQHKTPGGLIWGITYFLSKELNPNKFINTWNLLFSKNLNYQYVWDDKGEGIIHPSEPLQCVFFNTRAFKVLDNIIMNRKEVLSKKKDRTSKVGDTYLSPPDLSFPEWLKKAKCKNEKIEANNGYIIWKDGTWKDGTWEDGTWKDGFFENGTWEEGRFENGTFKGIWVNGIFENGTFKGTWKNGTWKNGTFENGVWNKGYIWSNKFKDYIVSKVDPNIFKDLEKESNSVEELEDKIR